MALSRLLRVLGDARCTSKGKAVHGKMITSGLLSDVYSHNNLLSMYVKCGQIEDARHLLEFMPERNVVSWTVVMSGYLNLGLAGEALQCLRWMASEEIAPNEFTCVTGLSACAAIETVKAGMEMHGMVYRTILDSANNNFVSNSLVNFYAKCGMLHLARKVFDGIMQPNVVSWATILSGYCQCGRNDEALRIFFQARNAGVEVNEFVFATVLVACSGLGEARVGRQVHCLIIKSGFISDKFIDATIIDLYVKCGELDSAGRAFVESVELSLASWTTLIGGYAQNGKAKEVFDLFSKMRLSGLQPNEHTFSSAIVACSNASAVEGGKQLQSLVLKSGFRFTAHIGNALLDCYAKCGLLQDATQIFEETGKQNIMSWNALIGGYVGLGDYEGAAELVRRIPTEGMQPDAYTYSIILSLCGDLPALQWGVQTHACVLKPGFDENVVVGSALVDMYAKCGGLTNARNVFENMTVKNAVSWNSMIVGYAQHGLGKEALDMFGMMLGECIKPSDITFLGVLSACAHMGLIEEGTLHFDSMIGDHGITPRINHFACMVDLFARGGQISRAYDFIMAMPMEPDQVIWRSLLSGCKIHGDLEMGRYAAKYISKLDPGDVSAHILLSGAYAKSEMWDERSEVRSDMNGLKKVAGCSWIEGKNRIHYFTAGNKVSNSIYDIVNELAIQMMDVRDVTNDTHT